MTVGILLWTLALLSLLGGVLWVAFVVSVAVGWVPRWIDRRLTAPDLQKVLAPCGGRGPGETISFTWTRRGSWSTGSWLPP